MRKSSRTTVWCFVARAAASRVENPAPHLHGRNQQGAGRRRQIVERPRPCAESRGQGRGNREPGVDSFCQAVGGSRHVVSTPRLLGNSDFLRYISPCWRGSKTRLG